MMHEPALSAPSSAQPLDGRQKLHEESPFRMILPLLVEAHACAPSRKDGAWEFAVEIQEFHARGVTNSQLRWLVSEELLEHRVEYTSCQSPRRRFAIPRNLSFPAKTCFLLTAQGLRLAAAGLLAAPFAAPARPGAAAHLAADTRPSFDARTRSLLLGRQLVKKFKVPAANQELILLAFEEEQWPSHIDDPLPPVSNIDPKKRLHDTIFRLNTHQKKQLLRFEGDGTARGVNWRRIDDGSAMAGVIQPR
jgi:hypothetical protein